MTTYEIWDPMSRRRCTIAGRFMLGWARVGMTNIKTGVTDVIEAPQPCLATDNRRFLLDPRSLVLAWDERVVYSPRAYSSKMGGFIGEWMVAHPEWPNDRSGDWDDVDDVLQLNDQAVQVEGKTDPDGIVRLRVPKKEQQA